jgi:two-component sensor histidine kinase
VRVGWKTLPQALVVHWVEEGAEVRDPEPKAGLGLTIVRTVVERQLGGTTDLHWSPNGLQATFQVPVEPQDLVATSSM